MRRAVSKSRSARPGRQKAAVIFFLTGDQSKLDAFLQLLSDYEILELARTGITGLSRGSDDIRYL